MVFITMQALQENQATSIEGGNAVNASLERFKIICARIHGLYNLG